MSETKDSLPVIIKGTEQLSDMQIRERLRPYVPTLIEKLIRLTNSRNDNVSLGAVKYALGKFLPDLSATDITSGGEKILSNVLQLPCKRPVDSPPETN